ncbi:MAG: CorA family divalent cation transporter, partial [Rhodoferax sp.]
MNELPSPAAHSHYGADQKGLICGFVFGRDGVGQPVEVDRAAQHLAEHTAGSGFVWLHFSLAQVSTEKWLRQHLQLSEVFYETLREASRSTRVELDDGTLVAVLNDVHYDFSFEPSDISTLWISVSESLIVTARLQPLRSVDRLRDAVRRGARIASSVALLVHLMHDQGDVLTNIVRQVTTRIDTIEDKLLAGRLESKRADLGVSRRLLVRLQRLLA